MTEKKRWIPRVTRNQTAAVREKPDACWSCGQLEGDEHKIDCASLREIAVVRLTIELVQTIRPGQGSKLDGHEVMAMLRNGLDNVTFAEGEVIRRCGDPFIANTPMPEDVPF